MDPNNPTIKEIVGGVILFLVVGFIFSVFFFGCKIGEAEEIDMVAVTIAAESAGEGEKGMYAVACTIANRARKWDKTPFEVVSQPNQYYGYTAKHRMERYEEVKVYVDWLAKNILELEDRTDGALYFRRYDEPRFKWCKVYCGRVGRHLFYK